MCTVKPVYNSQVGAAKSVQLKASFRYNRSVYKEIYAIGEKDRFVISANLL